ncbi:hypothetical protein KC19_VG004300 [Ceratodon purpureus]|uniref:Uncharacterized protein n=1 Tax=Ceratodon purpureus TaxID=3225 RepID=A0A8T0HKL2_CERPU|nr:hypothetical protein KC19_VG004300 [Ceratodon purpureus]
MLSWASYLHLLNPFERVKEEPKLAYVDAHFVSPPQASYGVFPVSRNLPVSEQTGTLCRLYFGEVVMASNGFVPISAPDQNYGRDKFCSLGTHRRRQVQGRTTPFQYLYPGFLAAPVLHHPALQVDGQSQSMGSQFMGPSPISHANVGMPFLGSTSYIHLRSQFIAGVAPTAMSCVSSSTYSGG